MLATFEDGNWLLRSPMARVVSVVTAAVKNRFKRKARPPNRGGFEVLRICTSPLIFILHDRRYRL